jgi:hypothetical protein
MIKAIETRYKGYKGCNFRSRQEAAWANHFDDMRLAWQYEPFTLHRQEYSPLHRSGKAHSRYTPDFSLEELSIFVEVKAAGTIVVNPHMSLAYKYSPFTQPVSGWPLILCVGDSLVPTPWRQYIHVYFTPADARRWGDRPVSEIKKVASFAEALAFCAQFWRDQLILNTLKGEGQ